MDSCRAPSASRHATVEGFSTEQVKTRFCLAPGRSLVPCQIEIDGLTKIRSPSPVSCRATLPGNLQDREIRNGKEVPGYADRGGTD